MRHIKDIIAELKSKLKTRDEEHHIKEFIHQNSLFETKKILYITVKRKWYDMVKAGIKKEEYREIKEYYYPRLGFRVNRNGKLVRKSGFEEFTHVIFRNGYHSNSPQFMIECRGIDIGPAVPEWSDNWEGNVFRIKLGRIV